MEASERLKKLSINGRNPNTDTGPRLKRKQQFEECSKKAVDQEGTIGVGKQPGDLVAVQDKEKPEKQSPTENHAPSESKGNSDNAIVCNSNCVSSLSASVFGLLQNGKKTTRQSSFQPPVSHLSGRFPTKGGLENQVHFKLPEKNNAVDEVVMLLPSVQFPREQLRLCPVCGIGFPTKGAFRNHLECHEGKRPFPCPVCLWSYETEIQLLEHHSSKHSKEAIFKCGGCGKTYKTQRGMTNHKILKSCQAPGSSRK